MKKSQKQLLSFLFHIFVLACMVLAYDAGKGLAQKLGWIESEKKPAESTEIDLMAQEEKLGTEIEASELLGRGLAAVIAAEGGMSRETFNAACDILMAEEPKIRNVALVIGSVIAYNCPEAENGSTITLSSTCAVVRSWTQFWPSISPWLSPSWRLSPPSGARM